MMNSIEENNDASPFVPSNQLPHSPPIKSCPLCDLADITGMIICTKCAVKFHPKCVAETDQVSDWMCPNCVKLCIGGEPEHQNMVTPPPNNPKQFSTKSASKGSSKRVNELKKLEEFRELESKLNDMATERWLTRQKEALRRHLDEKYRLEMESDDDISQFDEVEVNDAKKNMIQRFQKDQTTTIQEDAEAANQSMSMVGKRTNFEFSQMPSNVEPCNRNENSNLLPQLENRKDQWVDLSANVSSQPGNTFTSKSIHPPIQGVYPTSTYVPSIIKEVPEPIKSVYPTSNCVPSVVKGVPQPTQGVFSKPNYVQPTHNWMAQQSNDVPPTSDGILPTSSCPVTYNYSAFTQNRMPTMNNYVPVTFNSATLHDGGAAPNIGGNTQMFIGSQPISYAPLQWVPNAENNYRQFEMRKSLSKNLPNFSGRPEEWPLFISCFERSTLICGLSNEENMVRLQQSLKGEALEAVRSRLILPSRVPGVIQTLRELYGRPQIIINHLLEKVRREPAPKFERVDSIVKFSLAVENLCATIEASNLNAHLCNPTVLQELIDKLPMTLKYDWVNYIDQKQDVNLATFSTWLSSVSRKMSSIITTQNMFYSSSEIKTEKKSFKEKGFINAHSGETKINVVKQPDKTSGEPSIKVKICHACKGTCSALKECLIFNKFTRAQRMEVIRKNNLCFRCLRWHGRFKCRLFKECGIDGCTLKHHPLMHDPNFEKSKPVLMESSTAITPTNIHQSNNMAVLFRIVPIILYGNGKQLETHAFLDSGSSLTLLDQSIALEMGLHGEKSPLCLKWTSDTHRLESDSEKIDVEISSSINPLKRFKIKGARTVHKLSLPTQSLPIDMLRKSYHHLRGIPVEAYDNVSPRILIGMDNWDLCLPQKSREGKSDEPIASKSRLGWSVFGQCSMEVEKSKIHHSFHTCECDKDDILQKMVKDNYALESLGIVKSKKVIESSEVERARHILKSTSIYNGERYETGLLWRYDNVNLPDSFMMAQRRLNCLEAKMSKDPSLAVVLQNQISDHIQKGYIRKLTSEEIDNSPPNTWYLPIFPVKNPNKPGKIRLVWDAAAKSNGVCLNSVLLTGPDQLVSVLEILLKFRECKVAISADIQQMFHQIKIRESDQHAQRFLWRNHEEEEPSVYVVQVMTFGATCSPCSAQFIKNLNANRFIKSHPRAVEAIMTNHYVDDLLDSVDTPEEAIQLANDVRFVHSQGGFVIRNWRSNDQAVLRAIGEGAIDVNKKFTKHTELEKVLGMLWDSTNDSFSYKVNKERIGNDLLNGNRPPTKREVLKIVMSIFDPIGLLAQYLIYVKILLQEVWRAKVEWDEEIPEDLFKKWMYWLKYLPQIEKVSIPRCYFPTIPSDARMTMHIFVDASRDAFAAAIYLKPADFNSKCSLICAKARVAPLKLISIPRLELEAAVLGVRLANSTLQALRIKPISRHFWTDSKTVLCWIKSDTRKYRQFVAFRVTEILETTDEKEWRYVPSGMNTADLATKWQKNPTFNPHDEWYVGPKFLQQSSNEWPDDISIQHTSEEEIKLHIVHTTVPIVKCINTENFSSWRALRRRMVFVRRFIYNARSYRQKENRRVGSISQEEYVEAETKLFYLAQKEGYSDEYEILSNNHDRPNEQQKQLNKNSPIYMWNGYLDEDGVIRARGRIDAAKIAPNCVKRPILLPRSHHITKLIVMEYHLKYRHRNNETVTNELRQVFGIPRLRVVVKTITKTCQYCKNKRVMPLPPMMGELPNARLMSFTRPFSFIGTDYFGPLTVTMRRSTVKRWGMLVTCLTTRAVHIEVVHSLSTNSCILALRNFIARRGTPLEIHSDNGTNYKGTERELKDAWEKIDKEALMSEFTTPNTRWIFIPPASPHMGGSWERLVKSVKESLYSILPSNHYSSDEILYNMMTEVEATINSRPLTYLPLDSDQDEALTPNHFLLGSSSGMKPLGKYSNDECFEAKLYGGPTICRPVLETVASGISSHSNPTM